MTRYPRFLLLVSTNALVISLVHAALLLFHLELCFRRWDLEAILLIALALCPGSSVDKSPDIPQALISLASFLKGVGVLSLIKLTIKW